MRKKRLLIVTTLCFVIFLATACSSHTQVAELTLHENPTTGYSWTVQTDSSIKVESTYTADNSDKTLVGGGGKRTFTFTPSKDGTYHIVFTHLRNWEEAPIESIEYEIEVDNGKITQTYSSYKSSGDQRINAEPLQIQ